MQTALIIIFVVLAGLRLIPVITGIVDGFIGTVRIVINSLRVLVIAAAAGLVSLPMLFLPGDIPHEVKPWTPLDLDAEGEVFQGLKIRALAYNGDLCQAAVKASRARAQIMADREQSDACHIRNRMRLTGLSRARLAPVETQCSIAARLYLWERQVVQPMALEFLGSPVTRIRHYSSFSCRRMRTSRGTIGRMSQHATANAFDIAGFDLADGRRITLLSHWKGDGSEAAFLREVRDGLCEWFNVTLSPDYNALHADHFHVDMGPFLSCR